MTPAVYETLNIELAGGGAQFRFGGMKKKFAGFTVLYEEGQDEPAEKETALPKVAVGDSVTMADLAPEQHFTQPPPRYTEASLVRAMEEKGIGRPSTYAPTITTILARGYVTRENKALVPTELGVLVTEMMTENFKSIVDMQFTADMEEELDTVEEDGKDWHEVIEKFYGPFSEQLEAAEKNIEKVEVKDEVSDVQCDKCGAMMVYKMGRFGKFLACPNFPACRNTMPIVRAIDAHLPQVRRRDPRAQHQARARVLRLRAVPGVRLHLLGHARGRPLSGLRQPHGAQARPEEGHLLARLHKRELQAPRGGGGPRAGRGGIKSRKGA